MVLELERLPHPAQLLTTPQLAAGALASAFLPRLYGARSSLATPIFNACAQSCAIWARSGASPVTANAGSGSGGGGRAPGRRNALW